jgi:hypothetical protein
MKFSICSATYVAASIALLAGCGGQQFAGGEIASSPSRIDSTGPGHDLLYVTNANGVVNVYRYWQHTLAGVLTNFKQPEGECVDAAGNVYIADYGAKKVFEYAHGGSSPIKTIDTSPYAPYACAVNLANGDLAVANYFSYHQRGNIAIYRHAKGKAVIYNASFVLGFRSVAYDGKGNLLATNGNGFSSSSYGSTFAYLPKNAVKLIYMPFCYNSSCGGYWITVGGIQWDGKYWVFDASSALFRWTISNNKSQFVDAITLNGTYLGELGPFWLYRASPKASPTQVVGSSSSGSHGAVFYWKYPAGGNPIASVTKGLDAPFGVVGSLKP